MGKRFVVWLFTAVLPLLLIFFLINQKTKAGLAAPVVIDAILYDGQVTGELDEAVRLRNVTDVPYDLSAWKVTDGEATAVLPANTLLQSGSAIWLARNGAAFAQQFGHPPHFELQETDSAIPNLTGSWTGLNNSGDQMMLLDENGALVDCVAYEDKYEGECGTGWSGALVQPFGNGLFGGEGQILFRKRDEQSGFPLADTDTAADWAQDELDVIHGRRVWYPGWDVDTYFEPMKVTETAVLTVAVAPDNGYHVLVNQIEMAQHSIQIESLTFENIAIAQALEAAVQRGVDVTILLEGDPVGGVPDAEKYNCQLLEEAGGECWFMITNRDEDIFDRYRYLHAKFLILDGQRVIISSENLSPNSLPFDDKSDGTWGRRGVLLVTDAPTVVAHMAAIFAADWQTATHHDLFRWQADHEKYGQPPTQYAPVMESGGVSYTVRYLQPAVFEANFEFEIVQSPENSMRQTDGLFGLLHQAAAGDTILVQQLSERPYWGQNVADDPNPRLEAMIDAARRGASVRLLLDDFFNDNGATSNGATCNYVNLIAHTEQLDLACQLASPAGLGIHNKMILILLNGKGYSHIGSLNGSELASKGNREVALQIQSDDVYAYLATMFRQDWPNLYYLPLVQNDSLVPAQHLLISELLYNPNGPDDAEFVEIVNPGHQTIDLSNFSLSDARFPTDFEDLRRFPVGTLLNPGELLVVATTATGFKAEFGFNPDFEIVESDGTIANLIDDPTWGDTAAILQFGNSGDEVILRDAQNQVIDVVVYGSGAFPGQIGCLLIEQPHTSFERFPYWQDSDSCPFDFREWPFPNPGELN